MLSASPTPDPDAASVIYSESPAHNRLSWLHAAGSKDLALVFTIPGTAGIQFKAEQLSISVDDQPFMPLGRLALAAWQAHPAQFAYPMTANGQTFSIHLAKVGKPARQGTLLRQMLDGQTVQVRYYLTTGKGVDVRFPLAGFKNLAVSYFGVPPELEAGESERVTRCQSKKPSDEKTMRRCLGKFAPPAPGF